MNRELYDAFGELLYVLTKIDGEIQREEIQTLYQILENHPWSKEIIWSFNYEADHDSDIEDVYKKVIYACYEIGPNSEYTYMLEVLEVVAESSLGVDQQERDIIDRFKKDLIEEFQKQNK